jgi:hypothetical protein
MRTIRLKCALISFSSGKNSLQGRRGAGGLGGDHGRRSLRSREVAIGPARSRRPPNPVLRCFLRSLVGAGQGRGRLGRVS